MFIKKVRKTNGRTRKKYTYLHLVESVRTENGPRQKLILNLGNLPVDPSQFKALARRIEDILTGQNSFHEINKSVEKHAQTAALKIFEKQAKEINDSEVSDFRQIDINTLKISEPRSLGAEYICHSIWNQLNLDKVFLANGVTDKVLPVIKALVMGRLIDPGSERYIKGWVDHRSALYELSGKPLRDSLQSFYRATDKIFSLKEELEDHLVIKERELFSLDESLCFFDLTNTYFEGKCYNNTKAKYGRSKDKRNDCKQVTLGMIVDENGFSKYSKLFAGNQYEADTLKGMIKGLEEHTVCEKEKTIVFDAGIATAENLKWLIESGYKYIAVNRGNVPFEKDFSDMHVIREDPKAGIKIEVKRYSEKNEVYILCRSEQKKKKEESIRGRVEQLFLDRLKYFKSGLTKKNRVKRYTKVLEMIGRVKEKYPKAAKLYDVEVIVEEGKEASPKDINAVDIIWKKKEKKHNDQTKSEGSYVLRTNRTDLSDEEIWNIYIMLGRIEKSFKDMKSHLGIRPNYHQIERRIDAHMFIAVLAYHLMHVIEQRLYLNGDTRSWWTIKNILKTHERMTIEYKSREPDGQVKQNFLRLSSKLEGVHFQIYRRLGLPPVPISRRWLSNPRGQIGSDHTPD
jgi:transposase